MTTAWDPTLCEDVDASKSDSCPRCSRRDYRQHLLQTNGVAFYRCGACGHMFIVRSAPRVEEPAT